MEPKLKFSMITLLLIVVLGCNDTKIRALKNENTELKNRVEKLEKDISRIDGESILKQFVPYKPVLLDMFKLNQYQKIETNTGIFLILVKDVKPYLDGYEIVISIGNITTAKYNRYELDCIWGKKQDDSDLDGWQKSLRKDTFAFNNVLLPGIWNDVTLRLSSTKADELRYFLISIQSRNIILGN